MGKLVPEDFPMEQLANKAERVVVDALVDGLYDSWFVIPDVGMHGTDKDRQTDLVLVHPDMGVVLLETKGHRMAIRAGQWIGEEGTPLKPQPMAQAKDNAYDLRGRLRRIPGLDRIEVEYGVVLPNTRALEGDLPQETHPAQVLLSADLAGNTAVNDAVETLALLRRHSAALTPDQLAGDRRHAPARRRLPVGPRSSHRRDPGPAPNELCAAQVGGADPALQNRRVVVRGGAGTGKTRLAVAWAMTAWHEQDRVLVTCFNDPLAAASSVTSFPTTTDMVVGAFLRLALQLPGMPPLRVPEGADAEWWDTVATGHLHKYWPLIGVSFDTIIVDEAQDFSPAWLAQLQALLDPEGRRRLLLLADEGQGLYDRGFSFPHPDDGWVRAELVNNCRNARPIARLLRQKLGGAPAPSASPEGLGVHWRPADDVDGVVAGVAAEIERIVEGEGRNPAGVCVATFHTVIRDELRATLGLVGCDDADADDVVCENVHRLKGLEFDTVILATPDDEDDITTLYVGVSRAVTELVVVGPEPLAHRLGLQGSP